MEIMKGNWMWCLRLVAAAVAMSAWWQTADSQPLNIGCSLYNASNIPNFYNSLNVTFTDLRRQLSGGRSFATADEPRSSDPVYAMAQCRNYLSEPACLACFNTAAFRIRHNCSAANGARVIYDDCFIRYESKNFYNDSTVPGDIQICGNRTAPNNQSIAYGLAFIQDLVTATPRTNGFFAAASRVVSNRAANRNLTLYGVAQCAETIGRAGCQTCLNQALSNIQGCLPTVDGKAIDAACFLRYSDRPFFPANRTMDIAPFLLVEREKKNSSSKKWAIFGGVAGGAVIVLVLLALFLWYNFSRKMKASRRGNILGATELQGPNIYSYKDLKTATDNFSEENKLGEGGFGDVYKATLKNGTIVAVKKLDITYSTAKADFEAEVRLISNVHHRNLVRLLGCCSKQSELLLVYEYMANGSLDRFLYGNKRGSLTWKQRYDIIFGTARGLAYLHEQYHVCIIHRDIKPGNILLDDEFQAKIADFGLARLLPENQSHVSTKFAGTLGYTAPEYAIHGHLSEKVDTYSFGVVILEIISGRRSSDMNSASDTEFLLEEAWKLYESGTHQKLIDQALDSDEYKPEDLKKLIEIALSCTQSPTSSRPTMSEILVMLLSDRTTAEHKAPSRPSFSYGNNRVIGDMITSTSTGSSASNATASISQFTGR